MEDQYTPDKPPEFVFDEQAKQSLKGAAGVAGIAGLLIIITTLLDVIGFFMEIGRPQPAIELEGFEREEMPSGSIAMGVVFAVIKIVVCAFLIYFLYRFSNLTRSALSGNNQQQVTDGLRHLASYFKTLGVIFIIVCCIAVLAFFAILAGTGTA